MKVKIEWQKSSEVRPPNAHPLAQKKYYTISGNIENDKWYHNILSYHGNNFYDGCMMHNVVYWAELPDTPDYIKQ